MSKPAAIATGGRHSTDNLGADTQGAASHRAALRQFFARASQRVGVLAALRGAAVGMVVAACWEARRLMFSPTAGDTVGRAIANWPVAVATIVAGAGIGAAIEWTRARSRRNHIAEKVENGTNGAGNLLITAHELITSAFTPTAVTELVVIRAVRYANTLRVPQLFPSRLAVTWMVGGIVCAAALTMAGASWERGAVPSVAQTAAAVVSGDVTITNIDAMVTPPAYTKLATTTVRNPTRIDVLNGSAITLTVASRADSVIATTKSERRVLQRNGDGAFEFAFVGNEDGFVTLEPVTQGVQGSTRRLIGVSVHTDDMPRVRILDPTQDLIVPNANRTVNIRMSADDDFGVGSLKLRYTTVSGSGERFTFSEGEATVAVTRTSAKEWTARASLALETLLSDAGDLVVYRAVATDNRPGAVPVESDALIVELASPGGIAALGFSLDPDEDRYGLSQQMVILKTEKLIAKQASMTPPAVEEEARQLASEQRRVRAEFVFMMGGEFAQEVDAENSMGDLDETHEAESESDLSAGRMANRGRTSLLAAVRAMSRASSSLNTSQLAAALKSEKSALTLLQDAFARSRFLMRALSQREQLDMTRRLTGKMDSIARTRSPILTAELDAKHSALRSVLADLMVASAAPSREPTVFVGLAERLLQVDASSPPAQRIAAQLDRAGAALAASNRAKGGPATGVPTVRVLLDSAATGLTNMLRSGARPTPLAPPPAELRQLQRELTSARGVGRATGSTTGSATSGTGRSGGPP